MHSDAWLNQHILCSNGIHVSSKHKRMNRSFKNKMNVDTINTDLQAYTLSVLIYKCDAKLPINAEEEHTKIINSN